MEFTYPDIISVLYLILKHYALGNFSDMDYDITIFHRYIKISKVLYILLFSWHLLVYVA